MLFSDIDAAVKKYSKETDWEKLAEDAVESGMEKQVFYALYFTRYFLGTDIPDNALSKLKSEKTGLLERRFFNAVLKNRRKSKLGYLVYLSMVKGVINKCRFLFRTIFPPPSVLALTFNLSKPRVTAKDYLSFLKKQFYNLKNSLIRSS
jgi:hypothetical protein